MQRAFASRSILNGATASRFAPATKSVQQLRFAHKVRIGYSLPSIYTCQRIDS